MTIKEIIQSATLLLNRNYLDKYLEQGSSADQEVFDNIDKLIKLSNLVINELACTYVPMVKTETPLNVGSKLYFKDLTEKAMEVISVKDLSGNEVAFKHHHTYIKAEKSIGQITYRFSPKEFSLEEEIDFWEIPISARSLSYGLCAEFLLTEGSFDQALSFRKRYVDDVALIVCPKNRVIKERCWL